MKGRRKILRSRLADRLRRWLGLIGGVTGCWLSTLSAGEQDVAPADQDHWAFQEVADIPVPAVALTEKMRTPFDAFVVSKLNVADMTMAPPAARSSWFRRRHWALIGLPPLPEDARAFHEVSDDDVLNLEERWIDRLLASPAYGERRAQMWLDLARFAESDGFEFDHERKNAWRYRDWVIGAFNDDLPYDDFLSQQLAGDELYLGDDRTAEATGFLLGGPDMVGINLAEERRHNTLCEMTAAVGSVFLGLTVGCAQCHDHRTDPIPLRDYYAFQAFFANTITAPKRNQQLGHRVREPGPEAPVMRVKLRGDFRRLGEAVEPALLRSLTGAPLSPSSNGNSESFNRRARLARALTDSRNPLVARVMVNRLWQDVLGKGLVDSASDFGALGDRPSHPALLDWMAGEFAGRSWAIKPFLRMLLTSHVFQQASVGSESEGALALQRDPENRLYWRANRRRLSGKGFATPCCRPPDA